MQSNRARPRQLRHSRAEAGAGFLFIIPPQIGTPPSESSGFTSKRAPLSFGLDKGCWTGRGYGHNTNGEQRRQ
ncbi:zinc finger and BTB domain-containing protein 32 isoform X1 [Anopheles sinensis]|uniref:Zinc finger and BTB domain-containing protein 32 isoform X1 n=1 Tax=Anopheles sinensis TaxID=74873 RepID=A0A084VI52_ANOSI|nr:zinc finger and BTB domain-containing protein 32 isoform X1 [Anopheles sinensis]